MYQSLGRGFEVSGGARYLAFDEGTEIYVGTLSKYLGNWMLTGKVYYVPAEGDLDSTSYHGGFRRYFGGDSTSYVGVTYSHGFSREIRAAVDLTTLNSETVRGEFDGPAGGSGSSGLPRRAAENGRIARCSGRPPLTAGVSVQF